MSKANPPRAVSSGSGMSVADLRRVLPLAAWGAGAALALAAAVVAAHTDLGSQRLHAAIAAVLSPPQGPDRQVSEQISALSGGFEKQMRRQADAIRSMAEQHDSVAERVGAIERQLNELDAKLMRTATRLEGETRSAQQAAAAASAVAATNRAPQAKADPAEPATAPASPAASLLTRIAAPQAAAVQGHALAPSPSNFADAAAPTPSHTGNSTLPAAADGDGISGTVPPLLPQQQHQSTPPELWPATQAHRDGAKPPLPAAPPIFRSNPLMVTGIFATPAELGPTAGELAVDLGPAPTVEALRARWNELRISQSPLLDNLKPLISLKEGAKSGPELHLIAGPLPSQSAANRLCAVLVGTSALCQPTAYEGQRLATR